LTPAWGCVTSTAPVGIRRKGGPMDNVIVPLIVAGALAIPEVRRRAIAVGEASWRAACGLAAATVAGTSEVIRAAVRGEQHQTAELPSAPP
jgi:hypothetical protein